MTDHSDQLAVDKASLSQASEIDEMDCFGATRPILMMLFLLWAGLMIVYALTTG